MRRAPGSATEPRRRLAAVVFADIAGYTRIASENEDRALTLVGLFQEVARERFEAAGGRLVKFLGDGALAEFSSAEAAARAALAISRAFADRSREAGAPADLRVGVHLGEVVAAVDGDVYGDGVNVASRIQATAAPGQVVASDDVWRQLRRRPGFRLVDLGSRQLKGIQESVRVFEILPAEEAPHGAAPPPPATEPARGGLLAGGRRRLLAAVGAAGLVALGAWFALRDRGVGLGPGQAAAESAGPGIAVLPFTVNDPELDRWREGMVDLLSTNLDGAGGLRAIDSRTVLARWEARVGEGETADLDTALEVARESGAVYGLVGSAVSSRTDLRLVADVYDLETGGSLGQRRVEGSPDSIFGLVDRLSIDVLDLVLEEGRGSSSGINLASITTSSVAALKSYLAGEAALRRSDFEAAIPAYEEAVTADSTFALAWLHLSDALGWLERSSGQRTQQALLAASRHALRLPERERTLLEVSEAYHTGHPDATEFGRRATQRYPDDPQAWYLLGEVLFHLPNQSMATRADIDRVFTHALQLDPSYTPACIHLLDTAFQYADSAPIVALLGRFERNASATGYAQRYRFAYDLAYGTPAQRRATLMRLEELPIQFLRQATHSLKHPRFDAAVEELYARVLEGPGRVQIAADQANFIGLASTGRLRDALALLEEDGIDPDLRAGNLLFLHSTGFPVDRELLRQAAALPPDDSTSGPGLGDRLFLAALLAIEEGRRGDAEALRRRARTLVEHMTAKGDSMIARRFEVGSKALDGRAAMLDGDDERARELLEEAFRGGVGIAGRWIMELHAKAGRPEEALRYGRVPGPQSWLGIPMGRLYEKIGDRERALEAYGWVTLAWADADPELQPAFQEAHSAIARLEGLQRT